MLQPVSTCERSHGAPAGLARRLVFEYGWNTTSYQVLDPGMLLWFSAASDAVIGYVEAAGMRVVAGAPMAADDRLAAVAEEFESHSQAAGREVCYFAAEARLLGVLQHRRYASHLIGAQPIWGAQSWAQRFDASASLRAQRNRALNKGVRVEEVETARERAPELRACHAAWLGTKRLPRLHFVAHADLPIAGDGPLADHRLFVASSAADQNEVLGYLTLAPVPRRRGWLVEKIVRHPRAPNGTAELLVDQALRSVALSSERFTLGLAPLAGDAARPLQGPEPAGGIAGNEARWSGGPGAAEPRSTPSWLRFVEKLALRHGREFYDFSGLHAFKGKFKPDAWEPVYLLSTQPRLTPWTLLALAGAFLGGCRGAPSQVVEERAAA